MGGRAEVQLSQSHDFSTLETRLTGESCSFLVTEAGHDFARCGALCERRQQDPITDVHTHHPGGGS